MHPCNHFTHCVLSQLRRNMMVNLMNYAVVVAAVACCLHSAQAVDREDLAEAIARADVVSSSTSTARNLERKLAFRSAGSSETGAFDEVCAQLLQLGKFIQHAHAHVPFVQMFMHSDRRPADTFLPLPFRYHSARMLTSAVG